MGKRVIKLEKFEAIKVIKVIKVIRIINPKKKSLWENKIIRIKVLRRIEKENTKDQSQQTENQEDTADLYQAQVHVQGRDQGQTRAPTNRNIINRR